MQVILSDHNCEGQAEAILDVLRFNKTWLKLAPMELKWFRQIGLSDKAKESGSMATLPRSELSVVNRQPLIN